MAITIQSTYAEDFAKGYPGMVANGETSNRISRTVETAAGAAFGAPLYRGTNDHGCTTTVGTLATFYGWAIADRGIVPTSVSGAVDTYPQNSTAAILTLGAIYVSVKGAVTDGAAITVGTGAGAADLIGATAADATHIATGWVADETVTDGICRIVKR
jgi:hypothetical protein